MHVYKRKGRNGLVSLKKTIYEEQFNVIIIVIKTKTLSENICKKYGLTESPPLKIAKIG